jgi:raffinose/stachyose/melibiose transport system substrate-binding protein
VKPKQARKSWIVLLLVLLTATAALGSAQEKTRLLLWDADWGVSSAAVDALVAAFNEAHPDIEVVREQQANMREILRTALAAGEGPDIMNYDTGPAFAGVLARAGLLLPLDDAYEKYGWDERMFDIARERTSFDGKSYGIGHELELVGVFYNQRIFDELGLSEPETHDDMLQLCDELKAAGYFPIAFGNQQKWTAGHTFSVFSGNIVGKDTLAAAISGETAWNTPEFVSAIEIPFVEMKELGCFNPGINAITYDDMNLLFYSGSAAMSLTGTWMIPDYSNPDVMPDPVGFFFYPSVGGKSIAPPAGLGSGYFVSADVENPEAAYEFLDFLFSDEAAQVWVEELRRIPPVQLEGEFDVPELLSFTMEAVRESRDSMGYNIDVLVPNEFVTTMFDGFQEVIGGRRSPEEQADALQKAMDEAKANGEVIDITTD